MLRQQSTPQSMKMMAPTIQARHGLSFFSIPQSPKGATGSLHRQKFRGAAHARFPGPATHFMVFSPDRVRERRSHAGGRSEIYFTFGDARMAGDAANHLSGRVQPGYPGTA